MQAEAIDDEPTTTQLVLMWYPRVAGLITLIGSLTMINMAWKRRKFLFHRLVLGMAIHLMIYGLAYLVGTLAIPRDYDGYYGNFGTIGTCTVQGFSMFVCGRCALLYYMSFSVYSYIGVLNGFVKKKYMWCEKWIHIFVHIIFPVPVGIYYLFVQRYNPGEGFCTETSYPMGCDVENHVVCERGPDGNGANQINIMWLLPMVGGGLLPAIIMFTLYCKIREREEEPELGEPCVIKSRDIAIQSCVYLSALYWTQLPFIVIGGLRYYLKASSESLVPYSLVAQANFALFGLWTMLTYRNFSICSNKGNGTKKNADIEATTVDPASKERTTRNTGATDFIFNAEEQSSYGGGSSQSMTAKTAEPTRLEPVEQQQFSFNIFDGTNASGASIVDALVGACVPRQ